MWQSIKREEHEGRVHHHRFEQAGRTMSFAKVLAKWQKSEDFRQFFIELLAENPFPAFYWETPPLTLNQVKQPFEMVLVDSPSLACAHPNETPFSTYFRDPQQAVVSFDSLGRDAHLVVPAPQTQHRAYPHLAAFSRHAPKVQQHLLWQRVGRETQTRLGANPTWLSTSGLGVYWVHVRLDTRPKYYTYQAYKKLPQGGFQAD